MCSKYKNTQKCHVIKMEEWEEFGAAVSESGTCLTENNQNPRGTILEYTLYCSVSGRAEERWENA